MRMKAAASEAAPQTVARLSESCLRDQAGFNHSDDSESRPTVILSDLVLRVEVARRQADIRPHVEVRVV